MVFLGLGILCAWGAWEGHLLHLDLTALRSAGIETTGTIEMVSETRTKGRLGSSSSSYKFEVSYLDSSGTRHKATIPVSYSTYDSNTFERGTKFTRHAIDLIYLPSKPDVVRVRGDTDADNHWLFWILCLPTIVFFAGGSLYAWEFLSVFGLRKGRSTKQAGAIMSETPEAIIARPNSTLRTASNYQTGTTTFTNTGLNNTLCPDPSDREAWFQLGLSQISLSHFDEALVALEHAHRLGHPEAGKHLGYWRQKLRR